MLIIWDYFGVVAQDAFWYTADRLASGKGMSEEMHRAQIAADLGRISWGEYTAKVANDIGVPLGVVRARYQEHDIKQNTILAIHDLRDHHHVLLSNASAEYLLPIMQRLGLDSLFERIFVSSMIGVAKPDHRAFQIVLDEMGYKANDAVMIDDSPRNIAAAQTIGMYGIVYQPSVDLRSAIEAVLR